MLPSFFQLFCLSSQGKELLGPELVLGHDGHEVGAVFGHGVVYLDLSVPGKELSDGWAGEDVVISDALVTRDTLNLPVVVEEQGLSVKKGEKDYQLMAVLQVYKVHGPLIFPPTTEIWAQISSPS